MDFPTLIQRLTRKEKQDLYLLLKKEFRPGELETVREFFERLREDERMTARLRNAFGKAVEQYRQDPEHSCLNKAVKDAVFDDLYRWWGMGKKTWEDFVVLRGH